MLSEEIKRYVDVLAHDMDIRVRTDLLYYKTLDEDERRRFLKHRSAESRYFAKLNELAAENGQDCEYNDALNRQLRREGYTPYQRSKIEQKLKNGYAREVYRPGSDVTGTPPQNFFDRCVNSPLHKPGIAAVMAALARGRAAIEMIAATRYQRAQFDLEGVLAEIPSRTPAPRHFDGIQWSQPPFASADAIARREYSLESSDGNTLILHPMIDPVFVDAEDLIAQTDGSAQAPEPPNTGVRSKVGVIAAPVDEPIETISHLVEGLILQKSAEWDGKTCSQVRHVGRILIGVVGVDQVDKLAPGHLQDYSNVLAELPKSFGKSPQDADLALSDIIIRAQQLPREKVGFSAATIRRHLSQLRAILRYAGII